MIIKKPQSLIERWDRFDEEVPITDEEAQQALEEDGIGRCFGMLETLAIAREKHEELTRLEERPDN